MNYEQIQNKIGAAGTIEALSALLVEARAFMSINSIGGVGRKELLKKFGARGRQLGYSTIPEAGPEDSEKLAEVAAAPKICEAPVEVYEVAEESVRARKPYKKRKKKKVAKRKVAAKAPVEKEETEVVEEAGEPAAEEKQIPEEPLPDDGDLVLLDETLDIFDSSDEVEEADDIL